MGYALNKSERLAGLVMDRSKLCNELEKLENHCKNYPDANLDLVITNTKKLIAKLDSEINEALGRINLEVEND